MLARKNFFYRKLSFFVTLVCTMPVLYASTITQKPYYVAVDAGIFHGDFNQRYLDQTNTFRQNISESVSQNGYTGGIALGYSCFCNYQYLLGGELSGHVDTYYAKFQAGAATAAFSNTTKVKGHFDLVFAPGLMITESLTAYLKLGLSYALTSDTLSSPGGVFPVQANYNATQNVFGFAAALGVRKFLNDCVFTFAEANYHDYGNVSYSGFENFTTQYTHQARINTYDVVIGLAYRF